MESQYVIENLACGYNSNIVLKVNELEIHKGQLYFIVGASGIGKSTFLELLGLMNNITVIPKSKVVFNNENAKLDLLKLWDKLDDEISSFRTQNYSFIFQTTNLISHYTVGENIIIPMLLGGLNEKESLELIEPVMTKLDLPPKQYIGRKIYELSGGQKQRVAFIRAFLSDYLVLFGDEPTGNLDPLMADHLIKLLKEEIHKKKKTGIIVSHDIELAVKNADKIIVIKKQKIDDDKFIGNISKENVYNPSEYNSDDLKEIIFEYYNG